MTRTVRMHAVAKSLAALVGAAVPVPVRSTVARPGLAVAATLHDRWLGLLWRSVTLAISIPVQTLGGSAADTQASTMALRLPVPVVRKLLVLRNRAGAGGDGRCRAAESAAVPALVLAGLRCFRGTGRSRFCPSLKQRHRDGCQRNPLPYAAKRLPGRQASPRSGADHH